MELLNSMVESFYWEQLRIYNGQPTHILSAEVGHSADPLAECEKFTGR